MPAIKDINLSSSTLDHFHRSHTPEEYKSMMQELFKAFGLQSSRPQQNHDREQN